MGFLAPKAPKIAPPPKPAPLPPPPPPVPQPEDVQKEGSETKEKERRRLAAQQGRGATLLTNPAGVVGDDSSGLATKKLLGG